MWKKIVTVIAVLLLIAGIGFLLFPTVSNEIGKIKANGAIETFDAELDGAVDELEDASGKEPAKSYEEARARRLIDDEFYPIDSSGNRISDKRAVFKPDLDRLLVDSKAYNKSLINHQGTVDTSDYESAALKMGDYGLSNIYGYLSAPTINLSLPIYLGANKEMMSYGAAHMNNTSLPLNETNTNCAIAGHTGYVGRIFFDNIRNLKLGDSVSIRNYWETIRYKVIESKAVNDNQTEDVFIKPDRQLLTLITCTPLGNGKYGRYIVICEAE